MYLLGLDIGTTSVKALLYDAATAQAVAGTSRPTPVTQPRPTWAEHDPESLWQAVAASIREARAAAPPAPVLAVAVASMGEAGVPLDAAGTALYPIIAYYDRRTDPYVEQWRERMAPESLHAISGQILRPPFGVFKLLWLRDHAPEVYQRIHRWLSVGDYIIFRLSGAYATDRTLASRTMLLDQAQRDWSRPLLELAKLSPELLPPVYPGGTAVGRVTAAAAEATGLPVGATVATGGHDHLCAALALGVSHAGQALVSLGTAAAVLAPSAAFHGGGAVFTQGLSSYCHVVEDRYILQGGLGAAGAALAWLAALLNNGTVPPDYHALEQAAAAAPPGARGLLMLPHLRGSGTPERDYASRAAFVGLRDLHMPGDMWRAQLESIAFWARRNLEAIEAASERAITRLALTGGVARSTVFAQALADITGRTVTQPDIPEAAALGAALLAGQAVGTTPAPRDTSNDPTFNPDPQHHHRYDRLYHEAYLPLYTALRPIHHALENIMREARD